jgi:transposase InsO family protein
LTKLDNAVIESWHSTLEFELRRLEHFATRAAARARVAVWIEEYNTVRRFPGVVSVLRDVA